MFNVDKNITLTYVQNLFPDKRCTMSNYTMRNSQDYYLPKVHKSSLVPTVMREWNLLPLNITELDSLKTFTNAIICDDILNAKKHFWRQDSKYTCNSR